MAKRVGPHLLGAKPRPPDDRDLAASTHLAAVDPRTVPLSKRWVDREVVLDQGQTPHCVGFGGAQFSNVLPVDKKERNADGHSIYYDCKVADGEPGAEDGSDLRSLAKVLRDRGRINVYSFTSNLDDVKLWTLAKGPVIAATVWTQDMFYPSKSGYVSPTGTEAGGHCWLIVGYSTALDRFRALNSWSDGWGVGGFFYIRRRDLAKLSWSEFLTADELP